MAGLMDCGKVALKVGRKAQSLAGWKDIATAEWKVEMLDEQTAVTSVHRLVAMLAVARVRPMAAMTVAQKVA